MKYSILKRALCMVAIMSILICSIPMSAFAGEHVCIRVEKSRTFQSASKADDTYHTTKYHVVYKCQTCNASMGDDYVYEQERHTWRGYYEDLGHRNHYHRYRIHCTCCEATIDVEIICQYESNGVHSLPY